MGKDDTLDHSVFGEGRELLPNYVGKSFTKRFLSNTNQTDIKHLASRQPRPLDQFDVLFGFEEAPKLNYYLKV